MPKISTAATGTWRQYLAALIINTATIAIGISSGWTSPMIPQLESDHPPVGTEPMTKDQISWLTSITCIAPLFVLPVCNILAEKFGRKTLGCLMAAPMGLCWLLTLFANNFACLLVARILEGIGNGMIIFLVPIYVSEIASDDVRGTLGSFLGVASNLGLLLGFILGANLSYKVFAVCGMIVPFIFLAGFIFMPETPMYLLRKGNTEEATRSLMWLRNNDKTTVDGELRRLQKVLEEDVSTKETVGFKDLMRDRGTVWGFLIALALLPGQQTSGITVIFSYASKIFDMAQTSRNSSLPLNSSHPAKSSLPEAYSLSPNDQAIILAIIQVIGSILSTVTIERAGRRMLLLISNGGMAICHSIFGLFFVFQSLEYDITHFETWLPVTVLSFYTIFYCIGMASVAFVVACEVLSPDVRSFANSIAMSCIWIICFALVKGFPFAEALIGRYGCVFTFAVCCTCTFLFTYFVVPETKGRPIESILRELNGSSRKSKNADTVYQNSIKL